MEDFISLWDLVDVKPHRGKFTWTNKRIALGHIAARLDRFLVHKAFLESDFTASKITP